MKKLFFSSIVILFLIVTSNFNSQAYAQDEKEVIVHFSSIEGKQAAVQQATEILTAYENLPLISIKISENQIQILKQHPQINSIEENQNLFVNNQFELTMQPQLKRIVGT